MVYREVGVLPSTFILFLLKGIGTEHLKQCETLNWWKPDKGFPEMPHLSGFNESYFHNTCRYRMTYYNMLSYNILQ